MTSVRVIPSIAATSACVRVSRVRRKTDELTARWPPSYRPGSLGRLRQQLIEVGPMDVPPTGIEPATFGTGNQRSIH